ncbi:MAG: hypothetical protein AMXMBFR72_24580 [Betaproteobacteria bacterium]|jgi:hypothetical protein|nr:MAG: hypothetical protein BroJett031_38310 [Betaproteobacteria bacterium]
MPDTPPRIRMTRLAAFAVLVVAALLSGCATLSGTATQAIEIQAVDERDRAVRGMECRVANSAGEQVVTLPANEVQVRRSSAELEIECRLGAHVARGTAVPRGDAKMENSFIPGSSIAALVDHLSGYMYSYPTPLKLRVGEHLRFEFSDAPRAELVASLAPPGTAAPAPAGPLPVIATPVIPAQIPAQSAAPSAAGAAARATMRPQPNGRPVAAAPAAPPAIKHESLDPRDLRLRAGAH